jgi:hypothetical protein
MVATRFVTPALPHERLGAYLRQLAYTRHDPHERAHRAAKGLAVQADINRRPSRFDKRRLA